MIYFFWGQHSFKFSRDEAGILSLQGKERCCMYHQAVPGFYGILISAATVPVIVPDGHHLNSQANSTNPPSSAENRMLLPKAGGWGTLAPEVLYSVNSPWKMSDFQVIWMRPHTRKRSCRFMSCLHSCRLPWCTNCTSLLHSAGNSWCPCLHWPVHTVR